MLSKKERINLSQKQRLLVAGAYLFLLSVIFNSFGGNFEELIWDNNSDTSIWFYAGALMIVLGSYIVEPFFTKPSDAIVNSIAVLIALLGLSSKSQLIGYTCLFVYACLILVLSFATIYLSNSETEVLKQISKISYWVVEMFGKAKVIFSLVYLSSTYSYFAKPDTITAFISMILFWVCIIFFDVIGLVVNRIGRLLNYFKQKTKNEIGGAIGCDNPLLYKVEVDYSKHNISEIKYGEIVGIEIKENVCSIGIVVNIKQLLSKQWLNIYLLCNKSDEVIKINLSDKKLFTDRNTVFSKENLVYRISIEDVDDEAKKEIQENELYNRINNFVGFISNGSNINTINFTIVRSLNNSNSVIAEGTILETTIYGQETLYQVINGNTREERLENYDSHGYIIGIARKLGKYNREQKELDTCKWMPTMYTPVFFAYNEEISEIRLKQIAHDAIGRLPNTDMEIPLKDINSIVTHNSAILGILGIGKSFLAFELIKKIIEKNIKVICIDITNQYYYSDNGMKNYINETDIDVELCEDSLNELRNTKNNSGNSNNPNQWGNVSIYTRIIDERINQFMEKQDKKILILNPDWHPVTKALSNFNIASTVDLTVAEKNRIISERLFLYAKSKGETDQARYLIVYEEAHSLVPEWNSVANDGDKNATNGTAKVILQGRKFGLGCFIITQRTANVSKSILNQCNTIFALRVFDDTGKEFLQNYIGQDYADTLPTLEERHAIAIGKGLKLKQPVIIRLNERENVINKAF